MSLEIQKETIKSIKEYDDHSRFKNKIFSEDYVDFLYKNGWRLERKRPSNSSYYSDLLEDTDWESSNWSLMSSKHCRRDLDALS